MYVWLLPILVNEKSLKPFANFTKRFPEYNILPMFTQLRKCAVSDIVPSLTRLKKYASCNFSSHCFKTVSKSINKSEERSNLQKL